METGIQQRQRSRSLCLSEVMTILIAFHQQQYQNFKHYYLKQVSVYWRSEFPQLPSYQRFVAWLLDSLLPLCVYLKHCFGSCTGIGFFDSTSVKVCHNRRINQHRVFKGLAARGKTSVDWFFGWKLHLVVNERGELLNMTMTPGNIDDRKPVPDLVSALFGKIFAERLAVCDSNRGYVSAPLAIQLFEDFGIEFFAKPRRNMKKRVQRTPRSPRRALHQAEAHAFARQAAGA